MGGCRESYNIWRAIGWVFKSPYNESLSRRIDYVYHILKDGKNGLFWKDSFSYIYRIVCIFKNHDYVMDTSESIINPKGMISHPMWCTRCFIHHDKVCIICKLRKKNTLKRIVSKN